MLRRNLLVFSLTLSAGARAEVRTFSFGLPNSTPRPAIVYVPKAKKTGSLLVVLHGGSRNAVLTMNQDSDSEWNQIAEAAGWVVLYPSGTTNQKDPQKLIWNDCRFSWGTVAPVKPDTDDVGYLDALIRKVSQEEGLKHIFLAGHSNGAGMTFRMALESSLPLAGIAPMLMNLPRNPKRCEDRWLKPIPAAFLLGTKDPMVAFAGGTKGRSGAETLEWIRKKNDAKVEGKISTYDDAVKQDGPKGESSTIVRREFGPTDKQTNVIYFEVRGGGHQVPGPAPVEKWIVDWLGPKNRDLSIRQEIADFFQKQIEVSNKSQ